MSADSRRIRELERETPLLRQTAAQSSAKRAAEELRERQINESGLRVIQGAEVATQELLQARTAEAAAAEITQRAVTTEAVAAATAENVQQRVAHSEMRTQQAAVEIQSERQEAQHHLQESASKLQQDEQTLRSEFERQQAAAVELARKEQV